MAREDAIPARAALGALVVLGAALDPRGEAGPALIRRVAHARALWAAGAARLVIVTGGPEGARPTEAEVMRDALLALGVPAAAVIEERRARDTLENAAFTVPILRAHGIARALVVTDRYHLPRARLAFRLMGMPAAGSGPGWGAGPSDRAAALLREAAAIPILAARALVWRLSAPRR